MKKFNLGYILTQIIITAIVGAGLGIGAYYALLANAEKEPVVGVVFFIILGISLMLIVWIIIFANGGFSGASKKTMKDGLKNNSFQKVEQFSTHDGIIAIDCVDGRVGYVSNHNPKEFQIADRAEIKEARTDFIKGPLGGTTMVYFAFKFKGKKTKIPTLIADRPQALNSDKVLEAMSKADYYVGILQGKHN